MNAHNIHVLNAYYTQWGIITGPLDLNDTTHLNSVNTWFIYMKIWGNIAEGMVSLQNLKKVVFWLNVHC